MPELTVLIPIYNSERYLAMCLDSVLNQSQQSMEVICINDGSSDHSMDIIKEAATSDSRVSVVDKENSGFGNSLNRGLQLARGDYIGIIESDDFVDTTMYQKLLSIAKRHRADIVKSDFFEYTNGVSRKAGIIPTADANKLIAPCDNFAIFRAQPSIWSGIYSRAFLKDRNIIFTDSPGASFQDTAFNLKTLATSDNVWLTQDAFVHYRRDNEGSSIHSSGKLFAVCNEFDAFEKYMSSYPERMLKIQHPLQSVRFETYSWNLSRLSGQEQKDFYEHMLRKFTSLRSEGLIRPEDFSVEDAGLLELLLDGDQDFIHESIEARTAKYAHNDV